MAFRVRYYIFTRHKGAASRATEHTVSNCNQLCELMSEARQITAIIKANIVPAVATRAENSNLRSIIFYEISLDIIDSLLYISLTAALRQYVLKQTEHQSVIY